MGLDAEESGLFQTLWVGDNLMARRRPESIVVLSALASRTHRVRLGVGCMASFPVRNPLILAAQWATLDMLAGPGRLILAACTGGRRGGGDWEMEQRAFGIRQGQRLRRLEEGIEALRALWTQERATYLGDFVQLADVVSEPQPVTKPCPPIWIAVNPSPVRGDTSVTHHAIRRIARLADGWMVSRITPDDFSQRLQEILAARRQEGKSTATFENALYYNANINEDREAAYSESKRFLDAYYNTDWPEEWVRVEVAHGSPQEVIEKIHSYAAAGVKEITFRITSFDQRGQLERLMKEVLPALQRD